MVKEIEVLDEDFGVTLVGFVPKTVTRPLNNSVKNADGLTIVMPWTQVPGS